MNNAETLPILLKKLQLGGIQISWQSMSQQAEELCWTYPQYLATLCDVEVAIRDQRRIARNIVEAKLPVGKTLDTFDFGKAPSINAAQVTALAENTHWVSQAQNLIIFGPSGVGKTHLAAAIGRRLIEQGMRVLFIKTTALVHKLQLANNQHRLSDALAQLAKFQLLILDDIGYVKKSEAETSVLFELIADRYETKSLVITSNHAFDKWDDIFPNNIMAVAAIDRLVHHATIININELSYRKTSKK
jgi:DNA replication protein DnaC